MTRRKGSFIGKLLPLLTVLTGLGAATLLSGCFGGRSESPPRDAKTAANDHAPTTGRHAPGIRTAASFVQKTVVPFTYRNGEESGHFSIVESLGGGLALFDFDLDGRQDLFLPGGGKYEGRKLLGRDSALFRNEGNGTGPRSVDRMNWKFRDVTAAAGVGFAPYYSHGAAVADFDNDGFPDVLVTGYGGLLLFRNQGDGTFVEEARPAGLTDPLWSSSAAWGDLDGDGNLDLYVVHYANWSWENHPFCKSSTGNKREVCPPRRFKALPDTLYHSNGDGTFRDASQSAGLKPGGKGLGVVMADVDLDGRLDIYVTNDTVSNFLYRNLGKGRLKEVGLMSGTSRGDSGTPDGSMGTDVGDFNLDGLPDLWVANYEREAFALYRNDGDCAFTHVSQNHGVTALGGLFVGWGTVFFDFDRDGDEDLFVSNGHVIRYPLHTPLRQKPLLLENREGKRFINVAPSSGQYTSSAHMGRGVALGDIDNDGDLDLAVSHVNEKVALLCNETKTDNAWISLRLIGTRSSRTPIGTVVRVETTEGTQIRQLIGGGSYASARDPRLLFGLGKSRVKRIRIRWPSGREQLIDGIESNRSMTVIEGRMQR
ncbi:MAG: CRTAC1 family protein [Planctomycetaceae bacterium]